LLLIFYRYKGIFMSRRASFQKRPVPPDPVYNSRLVSMTVRRLMRSGKKSLASRLIYDAFKVIEERTGQAPLDVFEQAVKNATPLVEVKARRVGGATYQVPMEVRSDRGVALALRWLIQFSRQRAGKSMVVKLANELMDAANETGGAIRKREETHRMAEANKAFAHYRY
jgi:small subunit ribosomal protein S7